MKLWQGSTTEPRRLQQWAAMALQQAVKWVTEGLCRQVGEADLLRPRCCRNEQFREFE
jgi:hypothetical protein